MSRQSPQATGGLWRSGGAVRSTLLLLVVLAGVILLVIKVRADRQHSTIILGGPLFRIPAGDITGLLLTQGGAQVRFDKVGGETWTLTGSTEDYVDAKAMTSLLTELVAAQGGPILPGTEPEDRRYDFNGPQSLRLTVFSASHAKATLALGAVNPVTGDTYASGVGRPGCFMVSAKFQRRLAGLPRTVELKTLLPAVRAKDLDTIILGRGAHHHRLEKREDRWWLQVPPGGLRVLGADIMAYQHFYSDRLRTDDQGEWVLASDAAVRLLVYELSKIIVRNIMPADQTAAWSARWDLSQPWRTVVFRGEGINPDPTTGTSDRFELTLGEPLGSQLIPVARRGVVLLADSQASNSLDKPLGDLAYRKALTYLGMPAVRLELRREGKLVLAGEHAAGDVEGDGRLQWRTTFPATTPEGFSATRLGAITGELVVEIDRMKLLAPLPPTGGASPLQDRELVTVKLGYVQPDSSVQDKVFQVGYLKPGTAADQQAAVSGTPVGLWHPDTGQLVQVSDYLLVTARNLALH